MCICGDSIFNHFKGGFCVAEGCSCTKFEEKK